MNDAGCNVEADHRVYMDVRVLRPARRTAVRSGRFLLLGALLAAALLAGCASHSTGQQGQSTGHRAGAPQSPAQTAPASSAAATHALAATVDRTFDPYDSSGRLTVPVAKRLSGHCWEISLAAPTPHTYRCLAGNQILDPCFVAHPGVDSVACFTDPWSDAKVLRLTEPLPKSRLGANMQRPWALVLAAAGGSLRCVAVTGTAPFVKGVGLGYDCRNGSFAALRMSAAGKASAVVGRPNGHALHSLPVSVIWQG